MTVRRGLWTRTAALAAGTMLALGAAGCGAADDGDTDTDAPDTSASDTDDGGADEGTADDGAADDSSDDGGADDSSDDGGADDSSDYGGATDDSSDASADDYGPDTDLRTDAPPVAAADAVQTAQQEVGDGILHAVELDYDEDDAAWQLDVKILAGSTDHKVIIDAVSGDVVADESEETDDQEQAVDLEDPMTYDDALEKATAEVDGELRGWKLEYDDGMIQYQFDLTAGADEQEVTVDAETGDVTVD